MKRILIFGNSDTAEIAYEYFSNLEDHEVIGFTVDRVFMSEEKKFGLPVVPFEEVTNYFSPTDCEFFAACVYTGMNDLRKRVIESAAKSGFRLASYISPYAFVWRNCSLGEHCFIFENNTLQPFTKIGRNVILWSGNHIGHHSTIGSNTFVSSHVVISGDTTIGENCFLGVNSTLNNGVTIGNYCLIGSGAIITRDIPSYSVVIGTNIITGKNPREIL